MLECQNKKCDYSTDSEGAYRKHLKELPCWSKAIHNFQDKEFGTKFIRPRARVFSVVEDDEQGRPRYTKVFEVILDQEGSYEFMTCYFDRGRPEGVRRRPIFRAGSLQTILNEMKEAGFIAIDEGRLVVRRSGGRD